MKQKIVIKVYVRCKKCWSKAMKIVAVAEGKISSVAWEGEDKDKMVVIGDGVDAATLTGNLRKELGAELLLVEEVKEKKVAEEVKGKKVVAEVKKVTEPTPQFCHPYCPCKQQLCIQPSYPFEYRLCGPVVYGYEDPCTSTCNIM